MSKRISFFNLNELEIEAWRLGVQGCSNVEILNDIDEVFSRGSADLPLLLVARFDGILNLLDLVQKGFPQERIILLGSMNRDEDQRSALRLDILDWLPVPLTFQEIAIKTEWYLLRKFGPAAEKKDFNCLGNIESLKLTRKEERMLYFITQNESSTKDALFDYIWGDQKVTRKTIDVHLYNLRRKLRKIGRDIVQIENGQLKVA